MIFTKCVGTYLQVPQVPNFIAIPSSRILVLVNIFHLAIDLKLEPPLIGQMEQADEAEASANLLHLILGIRLLQTGDDGCERSSLCGVRRRSLVYVLFDRESARQYTKQ